MSAAIVFLADSGDVRHHQVWQSLNPTKLPKGAVRVKPVNLAYLSEGARLDHAINLLKATSFSYAKEAFYTIALRTLIPERRPKAEAAAQLMEVYKLWDSAELDQAFALLQKVKGRLQELNGWSRIPRLQKQEEALERVKCDCKKNQETEHTLADLYATILRRRSAHNFISIPSLGRRLYEGILDLLIREGAGIDLRGPPDRREISGLDLTRETERRVLAGAAELRDRQEVANALATRGVLDEAQIQELEKLYEEFRDVRNHSREEHGFGGVDEDQANRAIESVTKMMGLVFPVSTAQLMDHPFGVKALEEVAQGLRGWL